MGQGLRERKKTQTRRALIAAALGLFEAKGYDKTAVEEVASAAGVSSSTFFRYFRSKESVVFDGQEEYLEWLLREVRQRVSTGTDTRAVTDSFLSFAEYLKSRRSAVVAMFRIIAENEELNMQRLALREAWEEAIASEWARSVGMESANANMRLIVSTLTVALDHTIRAWAEADASLDLQEMTREALRDLRRSLRSSA